MGRMRCKGGCGKQIGSGCNCCSSDFPEGYGYCLDCYLKSEHCKEKVHILRSMIDRLDVSTLKLFYIFVEEYDEEYSKLYLKNIDDRIKVLNNG